MIPEAKHRFWKMNCHDLTFLFGSTESSERACIENWQRAREAFYHKPVINSQSDSEQCIFQYNHFRNLFCTMCSCIS